MAVTFAGAMAASHFTYFVFGVQVIAGLLVLLNRYVPLAIVTLAAVLANIWAFHITMWPSAIFPMPRPYLSTQCFVHWKTSSAHFW